ncbi:hypothetical protein BH11PSE3_BH11PSE3_32560 [soil metagenome]
MKTIVLALAALLSLVAAPSYAQLQGENLLLAPPAGFKVGFKESRNGMNMMEWVPAAETVQNWTEMVTVQIFLKRGDIEPAQFLGTLQAQWRGACQGTPPASITQDKVNGYAAGAMLLRCPLLPSTGRPETAMFRAIQGRDSFYLVQRAVRSAGSPEQMAGLQKYLADVSVCEAGSRVHPCPRLTPINK